MDEQARKAGAKGDVQMRGQKEVEIGLDGDPEQVAEAQRLIDEG